jgi:hypothetical protein
MILIEMHMSNPTRSAYTWARGQKWPVPLEEDPYVTRIEVFGPEYELTEKLLPAGRILDANAVWKLRDWIPIDAPYISELMRMFIESGAIK